MSTLLARRAIQRSRAALSDAMIKMVDSKWNDALGLLAESESNIEQAREELIRLKATDPNWKPLSQRKGRNAKVNKS